MNKTKKVKKNVEFLQTINITQLEQMLSELKNTSLMDVVTDLQTQARQTVLYSYHLKPQLKIESFLH